MVVSVHERNFKQLLHLIKPHKMHTKTRLEEKSFQSFNYNWIEKEKEAAKIMLVIFKTNVSQKQKVNIHSFQT